MSWLQKWEAISRECEELELALDHANRIPSPGELRAEVITRERALLEELLKLIETAEQEYAPPSVLEALATFRPPRITGFKTLGPVEKVRGAAGGCGYFTGLVRMVRARISRAVEREIEWSARTERAFEHLRRSLAVDPLGVGGRWADEADIDRTEPTGNQDEAGVEKLGAVHLLQHGLWAVKVRGGRGITDLVFADQPAEQLVTTAKRSHARFVLTEWKVIRSEEELGEKAATAREQLARYSADVLGEFTLVTTRYVVLVSSRELPPVSEVWSDDRSWVARHINVPIRPDTISKASRAAAHQSTRP